MKWNGTEQNGMKWNGIEWNGTEQNGMEWNWLEWNGLKLCISWALCRDQYDLSFFYWKHRLWTYVRTTLKRQFKLVNTVFILWVHFSVQNMNNPSIWDHLAPRATKLTYMLEDNWVVLHIKSIDSETSVFGKKNVKMGLIYMLMPLGLAPLI